ncbi:MAG TPA: hypothetical protein VFU13_07520 [Steroidobacteraceae bacterium]|nr:hypothetical protein [Steroidobacteraceae bacterium]
MPTLLRASLLIVVTSMLFACKPKPAPEQVAEAETAETESAAEEESSGASTMIEACEISMSEPESEDWTTYWDKASRVSPSSARSIYWADEEEKQLLLKRSVPVPLAIQCSTDASPKVSVSLSAPTSGEADVPLVAGEYRIVGKSSGRPLPGQFQAENISVGERSFEPVSGTLQITGFDSYGVRGSFQIQGKEAGEEGAAFSLQGTFDIPCRGGNMEGECDSNEAISSN